MEYTHLANSACNINTTTFKNLLCGCRHNFMSSCVWRICHSIIPSVKCLLHQLKSHESLHFRDTLWLHACRKVGDNTSQLAPLRILLTSRFAFYKINWIDKNTMVSACTSIIHYWPCCLIEDTILVCTTWETLHFLSKEVLYLYSFYVDKIICTIAYQEFMSGTANKLLCLHTRIFFPCAIALWNNLPPFLQNSNSLQTIYCSNSFILWLLS